MNKNVKKLAFAGVFAAMTFVLTFFVKVPVASGYVHFGDAIIYICACFLGGPWAMLAGAIGAGLAVSETEPMEGISGVSDLLPVEDQLKLIRAVLPDAKKIGILYTTSEMNSISTIEIYKNLAPKYGFEIVDKGIAKQAEVTQAADVLLNEVDCISNLTDNTVVAALSAVLEKANAKNIPVFGSEEEQVKNGCIASAGLDYLSLGVQAGNMAARVLKGEDISKIPFETIKESKLTVNESVASKLGIEIPEEISGNADIVK